MAAIARLVLPAVKRKRVMSQAMGNKSMGDRSWNTAPASRASNTPFFQLSGRDRSVHTNAHITNMHGISGKIVVL